MMPISSNIASAVLFQFLFGTALAASRLGQLAAANQTLRPSYDYVVIGAGTAGLAVANRLSEDSNNSVLVIEAGDFDLDEDYMIIPALGGAGGAIGTKYDWNISYAASDAVAGRAIPIPMGKVVGGSSKLNAMVLQRGSQSDYDRWADLGNEGWDWASLFPYFKKSETFTPPIDEIISEYNVTWDLAAHGFSGYVHSTFPPFFWPTIAFFARALGELGIPISRDQATGNALNGFWQPHTQDPVTQTRVSAEEAYFDSAESRPNFHLLSGHQVTRLLTETGSNGVVTVAGVEFAPSNSNGEDPMSVRVDKEAILAAGAVHSPQVLQVSGIGDPNLLADIGVETVVDLPAVGQNFQDHILVRVGYSINAPVVAANLTNNATFFQEALEEYLLDRTGPLTSAFGELLSFLPLSTYSNASAEIHAAAVAQDSAAFLPSNTTADFLKGYEKQVAVLNEKLLTTDSGLMEFIWQDGVLIVGLQHPYSRGTVRTISANVFDGVAADSGYLQNPLDVAVLVEAIRFVRQIAATAAIGELDPVELLPGPEVTTDEALEQFIRGTSSSIYHPAGTCAIGAREDGGVVDSELRVHGVKNLRVVDASVIPLLPGAHTMGTVYAVAEKAADIIKGVQQ
ncbi:hypothetical protein B0I35DRAFT_514229 [Stachybotrys elegans]|uniref:Glucose-methanol-choline oxidoreductase N-terminal domain-containing protein n=1 Tax=Stachybotrys elegans TaxID=80388 RepID=A0A8K0WP42_9HYPO|nr:hypothetical protein B0I35DRAFT_514229 [Stachybotrys elegans]